MVVTVKAGGIGGLEVVGFCADEGGDALEYALVDFFGEEAEM